MTDHTVGVDISKRHLDAFQLPGEKAAQFTNDAAGFRKLIAWIGKSIKCVAYEPTGPYHRDFEQALLKAKLPMAKVNPWQARRFAQATGQRAKTDAVDARMLACMAATLALRPTPLASKCQRALSDLQTGKNKLIRDRTAELNRGDHLRDPLLKQQHQTHLNMLNRHRRAIDTKIQELIAAEPHARPQGRDHRLDPRSGVEHRREPVGRDARTGHPPQPGRRQPGRVGPHRTRIRRLAGPPLHPGRAASRPPALIHARRGRDPLQSRHEANLSDTGRTRKTRQGRGRGHHAQTPGPGQRLDQARSPVDSPTTPGSHQTSHRPQPLAHAITRIHSAGIQPAKHPKDKLHTRPNLPIHTSGCPCLTTWILPAASRSAACPSRLAEVAQDHVGGDRGDLI